MQQILMAVALETVRQNAVLEKRVKEMVLDTTIDWDKYEREMAVSGANPYRGPSDESFEETLNSLGRGAAETFERTKGRCPVRIPCRGSNGERRPRD
jgi:hypothetical protein